ncbi:MAG: hypothetical protein ACRDNF_26725 [Streptosporangiaceae bacterium]
MHDKRGKRAQRLIITVACVLGAMGTGLPAAAASVAPGTAGTWRVDKYLPADTAEPPQEYSTGDTFLDVEAVGPDDAWAVGSSGYNLGAWGRPVLRHWHDGQWLSPKIPGWFNGSKVGGWVNALQAVGGSSPSDVWALGPYYLVDETVLRAVHWNGITWTRSTVPFQGSFAPQITSVVSFAGSGAWAFGCYCGASQSPYIAHFTDGHWRDVTPAGLPFGGIWTASAISSSNIWAVQGDANEGSFGALHWNGTTWASVAVPSSLTSGPDSFYPGGGLVASATGDVVFTGSLTSSGAAAVVTDDNGSWSVTEPAAANALGPLTPDGSGGLWAASEPLGNTSAQIWHYSGGQWSQAANPPGTGKSYAITWMTNVPGSQTTLAIGNDLKNELLLSTP